jgi:hypothetical protein
MVYVLNVAAVVGFRSADGLVLITGFVDEVSTEFIVIVSICFLQQMHKGARMKMSFFIAQLVLCFEGRLIRSLFQ